MPRSRLPARLIRGANRPSSQRSLLDLALSRLAALFPKDYRRMISDLSQAADCHEERR